MPASSCKAMLYTPMIEKTFNMNNTIILLYEKDIKAQLLNYSHSPWSAAPDDTWYSDLK